MNFDFNNKINELLKIILKNAQSQNLRVFFVGGIVRDNILNIPTLDIDLLLEGDAIEFSKSLPSKIKTKSFHKDFCTVKLEYENIEIDIASSRVETYPFSGCLPVVEKIGIPIEKDVLRRDFSINSLYCELKFDNDKIFYTLVDFTNGLKDIQNKTLRILHNKSYIDDPTRIIRGLGFKYRFGFDFSDNDKMLINQYINNIDYTNMSIDRNKKVIKQVLNSSFQQEIFKELVEKKYYKIINSLDIKVDFDLIMEIFDILTLDMISMSELYLKILTNKKIEKEKLNDSLDIYKTFAKYNDIDIAYYFYKTRDKNIYEYLKIRNIKLHLTGNDLLKIGYKQGKIIGEILDSLLKEKINAPKNFSKKQDELNWIVKNFHKN